MSYYEELPLYKQSLDFTIWVEKTVKNFPRYHKYTLGSELRNISREVTVLIARANAKKKRLDSLSKVRDKLEEMKILIRIGQELGVFAGFKSYEFAVAQVVGLARQNEGWLKRSGL